MPLFANQPALRSHHLRPLTRNIVSAALGVGMSCWGPMVQAQEVVQGTLISPSVVSEVVALPVVSAQVPNTQVSSTQTPATARHLGSGPIDLNNLPADVLNCDVCRQRLGLAPLHAAGSGSTLKFIAPATSTVPAVPNVNPTNVAIPIASSAPVANSSMRMLGSPGLISSSTAEQMEKGGLVVEEFKPPQVSPDAIRLDGIPPEVRQQFLKSLELPYGAQVMSANVQGSGNGRQGNNDAAIATSKEKGLSSSAASSHVDANAPSLGAPGIAAPSPGGTPSSPPSKVAVPSPLAPQELETKAAEQLTAPKPQAAPVSKPNPPQPKSDLVEQAGQAAQKVAAEKIQSLTSERDKLQQQQAAFDARLKQMQDEWQNRMNQADAANKEVLSLLEKRTAEVTELQLKLQLQQEAMAKFKADLEASAKAPESKPSDAADEPEPKKKEGKKKKPTKPTVDT